MNWKATILAQLHDVYAGSPWYGKPVRVILNEIEPTKAGLVPGGSEHSVFQIAAHMLTWRVFVAEKLQGNDAFKVVVNSEQDWGSGRDETPASWSALISEFDKNQVLLVKSIGNFPESRLDDTVPGKSYNFRHLIEGIIHHDIYHAGQIVSTAKIVGAYKPLD